MATEIRSELSPLANPNRAPVRENTLNLGQRILKFRLAYALIAPAVFAMIMVHLIPSLMAIYMSMLNIKPKTFGLFLGAPFVGLQNYQTLIFDRGNFVTSSLTYAARNTVYFVIGVNIGVVLIGMTAALLVNREFPGRGLVRTLLLTPWCVPTFVVGLLWGRMWSEDSGVINYALVKLHIVAADNAPFWLIGTHVIWALIIPAIWRGYPFTMIMLLSGLQSIPADLYEAARVDGASVMQRFYYITLPLLKPVTSVLLLWGVLTSVYSYNMVAMMFGNGAGYPGENGDQMMTAIIRQSFGQLWMGLGAAASTLTMLVVMLFVIIWYRVFRSVLTNAQ